MNIGIVVGIVAGIGLAIENLNLFAAIQQILVGVTFVGVNLFDLAFCRCTLGRIKRGINTAGSIG